MNLSIPSGRSFATAAFFLGLFGLHLASGSALAGEDAGTDARVARGKYLVTVAVCNDCHTPWKMGEAGPEPDMSRMLSGHPAKFEVTAPAKTPEGPWNMVAAPTNTAWSGYMEIGRASCRERV